jgi:hypothetical protein
LTGRLFDAGAPAGCSAVFSPCRTWRYRLERRWGEGPPCLFVGLNPSTADESVDDPTIRRCVGFARAWGFGGLLMGNLFGLRSTDPRGLLEHPAPVGPDADRWLVEMDAEAALTVAAWGTHSPAAVERLKLERAEVVRREVLSSGWKVLGLTAGGEPRHPLYMAASARAVAP